VDSKLWHQYSQALHLCNLAFWFQHGRDLLRIAERLEANFHTTPHWLEHTDRGWFCLRNNLGHGDFL